MIDGKAEKFPSFTLYAYAINNPEKFIDPDGNAVIAVNGSAQQAILNTLSKEDRSYVKFDKNGAIDPTLLNKSKSSSGNFSALKQLVNDDRNFDVNVTDKVTYKDETGKLIEKSMGPITESEEKVGNFGTNTGEDGWGGVFQTPGDKAHTYNSPDDNQKIVINSNLSIEGQAQNFAHEAYGHAFLFSKGKPYTHQVVSTPNGFKETNKELANAIRRAIEETIKNW